jgi:hypothetical protein
LSNLIRDETGEEPKALGLWWRKRGVLFHVKTVFTRARIIKNPAFSSDDEVKESRGVIRFFPVSGIFLQTSRQSCFSQVPGTDLRYQ